MAKRLRDDEVRVTAVASRDFHGTPALEELAPE